MNIKEKYEMERLNYAPTFLSPRDYRVLKNILRITQIHVETLLIMTLVRALALPLFWTVEVIVLCIAILIPISKGFWKAFERTYAVAELDHVREIEERQGRSVIVKEAV